MYWGNRNKSAHVQTFIQNDTKRQATYECINLNSKSWTRGKLPRFKKLPDKNPLSHDKHLMSSWMKLFGQVPTAQKSWHWMIDPLSNILELFGTFVESSRLMKIDKISDFLKVGQW